MSTDKQAGGLIEALFGKTRRQILALLFSHSDESFHLRKILRLAGVSPGSGQRELKRLSEAGIVLRMVKDSQVLFQANARCPVFDDLKGLVTKTAGLGDALKRVLEPLSGKLSLALLFGSVARGQAGRESDVDLMVVGECSFAEVVDKLFPAQELLRREINPVVMSREEFLKRLAVHDHFLASILKAPFIPVIGDPRELERMAKKRLGHKTSV